MNTLFVVSGGDAPGINTVIARYLALSDKTDTVLGVQGGFAGLLAGNITPLTERAVGPVAGLGGSTLASSREPVLAADDAEARLTAMLEKHHVDNVLLFGGDGSLKYTLPLLKQWGVPVIGLPTTIDNDVAGTDRTLGFDSAANYAYQAIEGVLATARALPGRIFLVETLGGDTGYLALEIALGAGAHIVLVPEYDYDDDWFAARLKASIEAHGHALTVLSEGVKKIPQMPELIPAKTSIRLRYTKLGHAQRGGHVTHLDRRLALDMARIALDEFRKGTTLGTIIVRGEQTMLYPDDLSGFELSPPNRTHYEFVNGL